ncbi:MAG: hypothetical protein Q9M40_05255 [Sulfurimonas sp.]|nr:hypothetical protein [Sulfurimonas sp.]
MHFSNLSFKTQVYLSISIFVVLIFVSGFSYNIISSYGSKKNSFINESKIEAGLIANNSIAPILFLDKEGLENSL